jgi:hypothetical protein
MARDFLLARDIPAQVVGAKEYTAHVLGGGSGHFELMVDPINLQLAQSTLALLNVMEPSEPLPPDYFRRAIFYAFVAAIVLPLIFNYASLVQAGRFWRESRKDTVAVVKMAVILFLQLLPLVTAIYLFRHHSP